jgi:Protein of unknown function (DUF1236)
MKIQTKTLLASVAALALMAGTGLASAQEQNSSKQPPTSSHSMKSSAAPKGQQSGMSHTGQNAQPSGQKMGQNAQPSGHKMGMGQNGQPSGRKMGMEHPGGKSTAQQHTRGTERYGATSSKGETSKLKGQHAQQNAQEINRSRKGNFERRGTAQTEQRGGTTARSTRSPGTTVSEQRTGRNGMQGLQGNASHVTLNDEQRTKIRQTVIGASGAPRVSHVDFNLAVGTVIPRGRIHVVPVPQTLVTIEPAWRGFLYFVYEDELVIVNPRDMRIVAVVPV